MALPVFDEDFCAWSESDVELKILYPFLTNQYPAGLGYESTDILTKSAIRTYRIGKGNEEKLYFPDFVISLHGYPQLVVETKAPDADVKSGFREARLYANELNAVYPSEVNPVRFIISCNGRSLLLGKVDAAQPLVEISYTELTNHSSVPLGKIIQTVSREKMLPMAREIAENSVARPFRRPIQGAGGLGVQSIELPHNKFGSIFSIDFKHLFNPTTLAEREDIARTAYVPSHRRERHVDFIDKVIKTTASPLLASFSTIEDSGDAREVTSAIGSGKSLEGRILLLIGSVGSGKTTFVDYLRIKATEEVRGATFWVHLNLNEAPTSNDSITAWIQKQLKDALLKNDLKNELETLEGLQKLYWANLREYSSILGLFPVDSSEYRTRLADLLIQFKSDVALTNQALVEYFVRSQGKLLVICFDNADKRNRDEQLTLFQAANWVREEYRSLIFLPLRDTTFELCKDLPPLDTVIKDLVFVIEPPKFSDVLGRRIELALAEIDDKGKKSYTTPNNIRITFDSSELSAYLKTIKKSVFEHQRFVRKTIMGLAGRDVRKAMEIFIDFCRSGHVTEDIIFRIKQSEGDYVIPSEIVKRVLLRRSRLFYSEEDSYIKNIFQCFPEDLRPSHIIRLAILRWLESPPNSPDGVSRKFIQGRELLGKLAQLGFERGCLLREINYLVKTGCIWTETSLGSLRCEDELVALSPSGRTHLELLGDVEYLAAVAEDTWMNDPDVVTTLTPDKSERDWLLQFHERLLRASTFLKHVRRYHEDSQEEIEATLQEHFGRYTDVTELHMRIDAMIETKKRAAEIMRAFFELRPGTETTAVVNGTKEYGVFVTFGMGARTLLHSSSLNEVYGASWPKIGDTVGVLIERVDVRQPRIWARAVKTR